MSEYLILAIGFLSQAFFSARVIVQWIMSEKAKRVLSPALFWIFSMAGAYLLCFYGWLRDDFAVVLGQIIAYYVYIWNLKIKGVWDKMNKLLQHIVNYTPLVLIALVVYNEMSKGDMTGIVDRFFDSDKAPLWLIIIGTIGQIVFALRFVVQWYYSKLKEESLFPASFWIISIVAAITIIIYAIFRRDIVLLVSQVSIILYIRNLMIHLKSKRSE